MTRDFTETFLFIIEKVSKLVAIKVDFFFVFLTVPDYIRGGPLSKEYSFNNTKNCFLFTNLNSLMNIFNDSF